MHCVSRLDGGTGFVGVLREDVVRWSGKILERCRFLVSARLSPTAATMIYSQSPIENQEFQCCINRPQ